MLYFIKRVCGVLFFSAVTVTAWAAPEFGVGDVVFGKNKTYAFVGKIIEIRDSGEVRFSFQGEGPDGTGMVQIVKTNGEVVTRALPHSITVEMEKPYAQVQWFQRDEEKFEGAPCPWYLEDLSGEVMDLGDFRRGGQVWARERFGLKGEAVRIFENGIAEIQWSGFVGSFYWPLKDLRVTEPSGDFRSQSLERTFPNPKWTDGVAEWVGEAVVMEKPLPQGERRGWMGRWRKSWSRLVPMIDFAGMSYEEIRRSLEIFISTDGREWAGADS